MSFLTGDGRLRNKHDRLEQRGERPTYLAESYFSLRNLEKEANRLSEIGYRIQSRQDLDGSSGLPYHVTFVYIEGADTRPPGIDVRLTPGAVRVPHGSAPSSSVSGATPHSGSHWGRRILITVSVMVVLFIGLLILAAVLPPTHTQSTGHHHAFTAVRWNIVAVTMPGAVVLTGWTGH